MPTFNPRNPFPEGPNPRPKKKAKPKPTPTRASGRVTDAAAPAARPAIQDEDEEIPYLKPSQHMMTGRVPDQAPPAPRNDFLTFLARLAALLAALLLMNRLRQLGYLLGLRKKRD